MKLGASAWDALPPPASAREAAARRAAGRVRMSAVSPATRAKATAMERLVPDWVRAVHRDWPRNADHVEPDSVIGLAARARGVAIYEIQRPLDVRALIARDEAIYWLLGMTRLSDGGVAALLGLDGPDVARAAMRRHARASGLPDIALDGDGA